VLFAGSLAAQPKKEPDTTIKSVPLTDEEREILENREMLENMELLENLDKLRYLELFKENIPEEQKTKPETNKDTRKKK
jgi:hypothetical protein